MEDTELDLNNTFIPCPRDNVWLERSVNNLEGAYDLLTYLRFFINF